LATPTLEAPGPAPPMSPGGETVIPLTPIRRAIADHMVRSRQTSPHAWMMMEVDMSPVVQLRGAWREEFKRRHGVGLTFLPFVARAVVEGLRRFPTLNSTWSEQGVVLKHDINLGIAIALEDNLIVPVIRNADRLTVTGLATAMGDLADRARTKRLKPDETQGGTFTLNNTGSLGTVMSQPIINQPQAAILAMDSIIKRPVVVAGASVRSGSGPVGGSDAIAVRAMMNLCISFDHRINDGLSATRFLKAVKETLETLDPAASLA
ncbi:MAG: dihydrolipoamide acetyltransferase family protein, partial [Candidatus Dormibacteria bacterium]